MNTVNINKTKLLEVLKNNLALHKSKYYEAIEDYKDAVLAICTRNLSIAQTGTMDDFNDIKKIPSKPHSYEEDYNTTITMLEFSVDSNVILTQSEFKQFVLDEWVWKHTFDTSNTMYKSMK